MAYLVVQSAMNFAQALPLDMAEIFTWYFEQRGVENPERFLDLEQLQLMKQTEKFQMGLQQMNLDKQVTTLLNGGVSPVESGKLKVESDLGAGVNNGVNVGVNDSPVLNEPSAPVNQQLSDNSSQDVQPAQGMPMASAVLPKLFEIANKHVLNNEERTNG